MLRDLVSVAVWLKESFLDLIYPRYCPFCEQKIAQVGKYLCDVCFNQLEIVKEGCRKCGGAIEKGSKITSRCNRCKRKIFYFNRAVAVGEYKGKFRDLILQIKFFHNAYLIKFLAGLLVEKLRRQDFIDFIDIMVPVPLSRMKLLQRGYNQAELLAYIVSKRLRIKLSRDNLIKVRETPPQSSLSDEQRQKNVVNVFRVKNHREFNGKNVLLIDDVLTTGATASECAKILKRAGAKVVYLAVVAR
jgi:ComF family protein